jgi:hypothetical protein
LACWFVLIVVGLCLTGFLPDPFAASINSSPPNRCINSHWGSAAHQYGSTARYGPTGGDNCTYAHAPASVGEVCRNW